MKPDANRLVAIDAATIAVVSLAICLFSQQLLLMTVLVPAVLVIRLVLTGWLDRGEGLSFKAELFFFALCTAMGGFNDWNSVVNHRIYDYGVPHYFAFSSIPIWMLLYWGMILRFIARLARFGSLAPPERPNDAFGLPGLRLRSGMVRVLAQLVLVLATRQCIYRLYLDPWWSWIPFVIALLLFGLLFSPDWHDLKLVALFLVGGPAIEVLYIQVASLHSYHLGWIGGVPLWIALWWLVIVLIWKDLALRLEGRLRVWFP